jgi:hypothetical protein
MVDILSALNNMLPTQLFALTAQHVTEACDCNDPGLSHRQGHWCRCLASSLSLSIHIGVFRYYDPPVRWLITAHDVRLRLKLLDYTCSIPFSVSTQLFSQID